MWLLYIPAFSTASLGQKAGGPFCPAGPSYPTFPYTYSVYGVANCEYLSAWLRNLDFPVAIRYRYV